MSKQNKVNKSNYVQDGRLTPDDMARERKRQSEVSARAKGSERVSASAPVPAKDAKRHQQNAARASSRPRTASEE